MGIMSKMLGQCRKPTGWLGRTVARGMNVSHSKMTSWGLGHISIGKNDTILDVGCGGGGTVRKLARIAAEGRVHGIDYSEESVRISMKTNRRLIESGRVEIRHGSVSSLPFPDDMFDLVTAIESHYFWPDLVKDMKEVLRVLKPGGMLLMMGGEYKGGKYDKRNQQWVELADMAYHSVDEFERLFCTVGCTEVQVLEDSDRGWMCGMGRKPLEVTNRVSYQKEQSMELGAFSISLAVVDIEASRTFYEKLGFKVFGGDVSQNWLILKNGDHAIGLFQGMFEKNTLTFNPGWDSNTRNLDSFTDIRDLQRHLKGQGVQFLSEADENTTGPASFVVVDPDGNPILVDQHV